MPLDIFGQSYMTRPKSGNNLAIGSWKSGDEIKLTFTREGFGAINYLLALATGPTPEIRISKRAQKNLREVAHMKAWTMELQSRTVTIRLEPSFNRAMFVAKVMSHIQCVDKRDA